MQLGKEYLNPLTCKFISFFSRQNLENFDIHHAFLPLVVAKLSTLKNSPVYFGPPCTYILPEVNLNLRPFFNDVHFTVKVRMCQV